MTSLVSIFVISLGLLAALSPAVATPAPTSSLTSINRLFARHYGQCDSLWWQSTAAWQKWSEKQCNRKLSYKEARHYRKQEPSTHKKQCSRNVKWNSKSVETRDSWENWSKGSKKGHGPGGYRESDDKSVRLWKSYDLQQWSRWQKVSQCRCEAVEFDPKNSLGVAVCFQIVWFNPNTGRFSGEITVFRFDSKDKSRREKRYDIQFKYSGSDIELSDRELGKDSEGWYRGLSAKYVWQAQGKKVVKFFIHGQLKVSGNPPSPKELSKLLAPSNYKLVSGKEGKSSNLVEGRDYKNLRMEGYVPEEPFAPALRDNPKGKCTDQAGNESSDNGSAQGAGKGPAKGSRPKPSTTKKPPSGGDPSTKEGKGTDGAGKGSADKGPAKGSPPKPSTTKKPSNGDDPSTKDGNGTDEAGKGNSNNGSPKGSPPEPASTKKPSNGDYPSDYPTSPDDQAPPSSTAENGETNPNNPSASTTSDAGVPTAAATNADSTAVAANANSTAVAANADSQGKPDNDVSQSTPGQTLGVLPVGLIVFGGLLLVATTVVGYNTWTRRRYREQFRRRKEMEQQASSPSFGIAQ